MLILQPYYASQTTGIDLGVILMCYFQLVDLKFRLNFLF